MTEDSAGRPGNVVTEGYGKPIAGLLAFLFALMAGMTLGSALGGSIGDLALPAVFGAVSVVCFRYHQRFAAARESAE